MKRLPASGRVIVTGACVEVEDTGGIERVAIHPDHVLLVDRSHLPAVAELAQGTLPYPSAEVGVGFRPDEVVDADRYGLFIREHYERKDREDSRDAALHCHVVHGVLLATE